MVEAKKRRNGAQASAAHVTLAQYKVDVDMSIPQRMAHLFDWYAENAPKRWLHWPQVTKIVMVMPKKPVEHSADVKKVRSRASAVEKILMEKYGRTLRNEKLNGVRASADEDDKGDRLVQRNKRVVSAINAAATTASLVDVRQIHDPQLQRQVRQSTQTVKQFANPELLNKLLPPGPDGK